jgi:hypothetical protein
MSHHGVVAVAILMVVAVISHVLGVDPGDGVEDSHPEHRAGRST